ncbi:hypothetical protein AFLA_013548 [Aspergillus flavus NRRL3357]|nr:hypothetical protein AFLA_013548 [Aspergillus flavus NRRL3357]
MTAIPNLELLLASNFWNGTTAVCDVHTEFDSAVIVYLLGLRLSGIWKSSETTRAGETRRRLPNRPKDHFSCHRIASYSRYN